jgi:hypothetical protein
VCGYLSPSYARTAFATTGGCAQWIKSTAGRLTAEQQDALKTVKVLGATPGPRAGQYTVQPDDLSWRAGTAVPSGVVAKRYVLARSGARWLVVA